MRIEDTYLEICKGHLLCDKQRCFTCKIGKRNSKEICYRPVLLNRDYQGREVTGVLRKDLEKLSDNSREESTFFEKTSFHTKNSFFLPDTSPKPHPTPPIDYYSCGQDEEGGLIDFYSDNLGEEA